MERSPTSGDARVHLEEISMERLSLLAAGAAIAFAASGASAAAFFESFESGTTGIFGPAEDGDPGTPLPSLTVSTLNATDGTNSVLATQAADGFNQYLRSLDLFEIDDAGTTLSDAFKVGGTLTGDVFLVAGAGSAAPEVFMARQGGSVGFDLTDGDGNFNFAPLTDGASASFSFGVPALPGETGVIGFSLGAQNVGPDAQLFFDNIVFTPIPEPASVGLLGMGLLGLVARRRR
ncbi:MAG: PEP-CTERM sorting domain-containing protein [Planctomycetota bacterium]